MDILNLNLGNPPSILNMLRRCDIPARIINTPEEVASSERLIIPGVGSFDAGMEALEPFRDELTALANTGVPLLGICLGMQMLGTGSTEGSRPGLGLLPVEFERFPDHQTVPCMGWNHVVPKPDHPLFAGLSEPRFYFVHSYHAVGDAHRIGATWYGDTYSSAIGRDHVLGVQFHPEKSHRYGMQLLRNFGEI